MEPSEFTEYLQLTAGGWQEAHKDKKFSTPPLINMMNHQTWDPANLVPLFVKVRDGPSCFYVIQNFLHLCGNARQFILTVSHFLSILNLGSR